VADLESVHDPRGQGSLLGAEAHRLTAASPDAVAGRGRRRRPEPRLPKVVVAVAVGVRDGLQGSGEPPDRHEERKLELESAL
jgi:hypothetical protein